MKDRPSPVIELVTVSTDHKNWSSGKYYFNIFGTEEEMHNVHLEEVIEINRRISELLNEINGKGNAL
jgi:hypothetical protein